MKIFDKSLPTSNPKDIPEPQSPEPLSAEEIKLFASGSGEEGTGINIDKAIAEANKATPTITATETPTTPEAETKTEITPTAEEVKAAPPTEVTATPAGAGAVKTPVEQIKAEEVVEATGLKSETTVELIEKFTAIDNKCRQMLKSFRWGPDNQQQSLEKVEALSVEFNQMILLLQEQVNKIEAGTDKSELNTIIKKGEKMRDYLLRLYTIIKNNKSGVIKRGIVKIKDAKGVEGGELPAEPPAPSEIKSELKFTPESWDGILKLLAELGDKAALPELKMEWRQLEGEAAPRAVLRSESIAELDKFLAEHLANINPEQRAYLHKFLVKSIEQKFTAAIDTRADIELSRFKYHKKEISVLVGGGAGIAAISALVRFKLGAVSLASNLVGAAAPSLMEAAGRVAYTVVLATVFAGASTYVREKINPVLKKWFKLDEAAIKNRQAVSQKIAQQLMQADTVKTVTEHTLRETLSTILGSDSSADPKSRQPVQELLAQQAPEVPPEQRERLSRMFMAMNVMSQRSERKLDQFISLSNYSSEQKPTAEQAEQNVILQRVLNGMGKSFVYSSMMSTTAEATNIIAQGGAATVGAIGLTSAVLGTKMFGGTYANWLQKTEIRKRYGELEESVTLSLSGDQDKAKTTPEALKEQTHRVMAYLTAGLLDKDPVLRAQAVQFLLKAQERGVEVDIKSVSEQVDNLEKQFLDKDQRIKNKSRLFGFLTGAAFGTIGTVAGKLLVDLVGREPQGWVERVLPETIAIKGGVAKLTQLVTEQEPLPADVSQPGPTPAAGTTIEEILEANQSLRGFIHKYGFTAEEIAKLYPTKLTNLPGYLEQFDQTVTTAKITPEQAHYLVAHHPELFAGGRVPSIEELHNILFSPSFKNELLEVLKAGGLNDEQVQVFVDKYGVPPGYIPSAAQIKEFTETGAIKAWDELAAQGKLPVEVSPEPIVQPLEVDEVMNLLQQYHAAELADVDHPFSVDPATGAITRSGYSGVYTIDKDTGTLYYSGGQTPDGTIVGPMAKAPGASGWIEIKGPEVKGVPEQIAEDYKAYKARVTSGGIPEINPVEAKLVRAGIPADDIKLFMERHGGKMPTDAEINEYLDKFTVQKGEGVEHQGIAQILDNPRKFGYQGDLTDIKAIKAFAGRLAHEAALHTKWGDQAVVEVKDGVMTEVRLKASAIGKTILLVPEPGGGAHYEFAPEFKTTDTYLYSHDIAPQKTYTSWEQATAQVEGESDQTVAWQEQLSKHPTQYHLLSEQEFNYGSARDLPVYALDYDNDSVVDGYALVDGVHHELVQELPVHESVEVQKIYDTVTAQADRVAKVGGEVAQTWSTAERFEVAVNAKTDQEIMGIIEHLGQRAPAMLKDEGFSYYSLTHIKELTPERAEALFEIGSKFKSAGFSQVDYTVVEEQLARGVHKIDIILDHDKPAIALLDNQGFVRSSPLDQSAIAVPVKQGEVLDYNTYQNYLKKVNELFLAHQQMYQRLHGILSNQKELFQVLNLPCRQATPEGIESLTANHILGIKVSSGGAEELYNFLKQPDVLGNNYINRPDTVGQALVEKVNQFVLSGSK